MYEIITIKPIVLHSNLRKTPKGMGEMQKTKKKDMRFIYTLKYFQLTVKGNCVIGSDMVEPQDVS